MLSKHGKVFDFISDYLIFALASLNISLSLLFSLFALESELLFFILPSIIYTILLFPIIYFISKNKNSILIFILALILIFIGMSMLAGPGLYSWLRGYVFRVSSVNLFYSQITIFLLNLIICSLIYFSFFKLKSFLPFVLIGGSIFVAQSEIMNIHWSKILFYSYIFLVLIIIFYISSKKNVISVEKGEKSYYVAFFIPACILLCLVFFFIPKQQKALIDEKDSKDFFENIVVAVNIIADMFQDEGRSFSYGGSNFGLNESFLGGCFFI